MTLLLLLWSTQSDGDRQASHTPPFTPTENILEHIESDNNIQCEWNRKGRENVEQNKIVWRGSNPGRLPGESGPLA